MNADEKIIVSQGVGFVDLLKVLSALERIDNRTFEENDPINEVHSLVQKQGHI
jgi:hypothetical protein